MPDPNLLELVAGDDFELMDLDFTRGCSCAGCGDPRACLDREKSRHGSNPREGALATPMRTRLNLKPRQRGTKKLLAKYGDRLVCVRYRYDERSSKRLKAVELIVKGGDWRPRASPAPGRLSPSRPLRGDHEVVALRVDWGEVDLRHAVKAVGGRWVPEKRVRMLPYDRVTALGLEDRIVEHGGIQM